MTYKDLKRGFRKKRVSLIYVSYWLMLAYIIAALIFWFIALDTQNIQIAKFKQDQLHTDDTTYNQELQKIKKEEERKTFQYIGEGVTFLVLIVAGAILVFRMIKTQIKIARQQKDFMMAITHELKTPIAVTKLNLETLQKRQLDHDRQQRLITATLSETDRLNALCSNMLLMNEMDLEGYKICQEEILLSDLITECVNEFKARFPIRKFETEIEPDLLISGDRILLKLAINNLLDNATKYSPRESTVTIVANKNDHHTDIRVIDEGSGVSESEMKNIFEKYFRGSQRQTKGTGLGLYVTRQIIRQSKGRLSVIANHPKGSVFTISFAS